jgi:hypothetical protein
MRLQELEKVIDGKVLVTPEADVEIDCAYCADLLSDVLALTKGRTTLITGLINPQVIRVAEILNIVAIIFVRGKRPPAATVKFAGELGIPLVATEKTMFETCGLMYAHGVHPCSIHPLPAQKPNG